MPVDLRVSVDVKQFKKEFRALKAKSFAFALKNAADKSARTFVGLFTAQWKRDFTVRRAGFTKSALRIIRARVDKNRGLVVRQTRILSKPFADEILNAQIEGKSNRKPRGRVWGIPVDRKRIGKAAKNFIAGKYVFQSRRGGNSKLIGVLEQTVDVPKRFDLRKITIITSRYFPREIRKQLRKELEFRQRGG